MSPFGVQSLRLLIEDRAGRVFDRGSNPFYVLGALAFFFLWLLIVSGAYLLLVYRLNIDGAYESIQSLTERQPYWGGIVRSLHRYAADGLMIAMVLHGLRTFLADQYRHARWMAWVTGVVVLGVVWVEGILGYWMVWDDRAQLIALKTAEFLDVLPIVGAPLPRAFLSRDLVTNLFFFVIIALHIALPVLALIGLWLHVSRITRPVITPPRGLMAGVLLLTLILCAVNPATSGPPADPGRLPADLPLDWFYLGAYPILAALPAGLSWILLVAGASALIAVPWLFAPRRAKPVSLVLTRCNACALCYEDCPYEAISMRPRTDGRPYDRQAEIDPARCVSCGICIGSCSTAALLLPDASLIGMLTEIRKRRSALRVSREPSMLVFVCERAVPVDQVRRDAPWLAPIALPCIGAIHPLVIERALRSGAAGVFVAGCPEGDCHERTGSRWLADRLAGRRNPSARRPIDLSKVRIAEYSPVRAAELAAEVEAFARRVTPGRPQPSASRVPGWSRRLAAGAWLSLPAVMIAAFSGRPVYSFYPRDAALLVASLQYTAEPRACRERGAEELARVPEHMRTPLACTRERRDVVVRLEIDGKERLAKTYRPAGLRSDGPAYVYEKFTVAPGLHDVRLDVREAGGPEKTLRSERVDVPAGRVVLLP